LPVVVKVKFNQSSYSATEKNKVTSFKQVLVLSNPSSTNITVEIENIDGTATGTYVTYFNFVVNLYTVIIS